jgi:hypothetical protein
MNKGNLKGITKMMNLRTKTWFRWKNPSKKPEKTIVRLKSKRKEILRAQAKKIAIRCFEKSQ